MRLIWWNVAGLASKLGTQDWITYIESGDVCMFQETWAREDYNHQGYESFSIAARWEGKGRPSGGLTTWVASHLGCQASRLPVPSDDILVVLLAWPNLAKLALINIYSRPVGASRESPTIEELSVYLAEMPRDIPYIVGGDLNSHFEPLVGLVEGFPMEEEFRWSVPPVVAPSPKAWTPVALQITALTLKHGIRACNGRIKSDVPSKTTYNRVGRESRLDYALVQIVNWSSILDFRVVERLDSDHNALELDSSHPGPKGSITTMGGSKPELLLDNNRRRIRWDKLATSQVKLSKLYAGLIPILEKVGELANDVGNIVHHEKLYQAHEDLIKGAASELFTRVQNQKRIQQHNSLWYNAVCRKAKGELLRCIKEGTDREKLRESRRAYKYWSSMLKPNGRRTSGRSLPLPSQQETTECFGE
ncbi:hypothetical protein NDU88_002780 [Pleurodeles waltl]|uniref:Endonuclease/exonuclease/phosphatase domain-containing protein n=1 Tax=Pleurodeles waltl TaxID=8319 RepID=A0AAV7P9A2_PLEWA|nr:hypothetical protein NDU88_002780 [Pleurodeles waltl]